MYVQVNGGLLFFMFIIFLILKLAGVIGWSWWLVTLPLWIIPAISIVIYAVMFVLVVIVGLIAGIIMAILELDR